MFSVQCWRGTQTLGLSTFPSLNIPCTIITTNVGFVCQARRRNHHRTRPLPMQCRQIPTEEFTPSLTCVEVYYVNSNIVEIGTQWGWNFLQGGASIKKFQIAICIVVVEASLTDIVFMRKGNIPPIILCRSLLSASYLQTWGLFNFGGIRSDGTMRVL